jgi:uncharacterized Zn finger protein
MFYEWRPYVSAAERRLDAAREMAKLKKKGHPVSPVVIDGRTIAGTFWGKAWCDNLERYSDYANRLPRGRTYVRNGSVIDLQVKEGEVSALVSGSEIYKVAVKVAQVPTMHWKSICKDCAGAIDSLVELLQGRFSKGVMERICRQGTGLFPAPDEIKFSCSCPDWAWMCKHVAAVLYGIGARLDKQPELLFKLRKVNERDLIARAARGLPLGGRAPAAERVLDESGLSELFGLEMAEGAQAEAEAKPVRKAKKRPVNAKKVKPSGRKGKNAKSGGKSSRKKPRAAKPRPQREFNREL